MSLEARLKGAPVPAHRVALVLADEAGEWGQGGGVVGFAAAAALAELARVWGGFDVQVDPESVRRDAEAVAEAILEAADHAAEAARTRSSGR